jgi:hypothetical protein
VDRCLASIWDPFIGVSCLSDQPPAEREREKACKNRCGNSHVAYVSFSERNEWCWNSVSSSKCYVNYLLLQYWIVTVSSGLRRRLKKFRKVYAIYCGNEGTSSSASDVGRYVIIAKFLGMGWHSVHLIRRPLTGLLYQPRMIDDECGAVGGLRIGGGNRNTQKEPAPVPLCPPQIPHDLTWAWTRAVAMGSRRLTAWALARPVHYEVARCNFRYTSGIRTPMIN